MFIRITKTKQKKKQKKSESLRVFHFLKSKVKIKQDYLSVYKKTDTYEHFGHKKKTVCPSAM